MAWTQRIPDTHLIGDVMGVQLEQMLVRMEHAASGGSGLDGDMTIEAKPTWYAGTVFRSRLEADWAATLDTVGVRWEYEPQTIALPSGATYIPDFRLPEIGMWLEVKGPGVPRIEKTIELGETLACHCDGDCVCEWPHGEFVVIGQAPEPYRLEDDPHWPEPEDNPFGHEDHTPEWVLAHRIRRHPGHPRWTTALRRTVWLARCPWCERGGWTLGRFCRACEQPLLAQIHHSGDPELRFVRSLGCPAPTADAEPRGDSHA